MRSRYSNLNLPTICARAGGAGAGAARSKASVKSQPPIIVQQVANIYNSSLRNQPAARALDMPARPTRLPLLTNAASARTLTLTGEHARSLPYVYTK